jgi:hypothetical protein
MPEFDFRRFLTDQFRSPAALQALLAAYGYDAITVSAVRKWFARGSIPAHIFPILLVLGELEQGKRVELMTYVREGRTNEEKRIYKPPSDME